MQSSLNMFGALAIAGVTTANKIEGIVSQAYGALGTAIATYCAQNIGAGKIDRVRKGFRSTGAPASDYITVKNADVVAKFMEENKIPFVKGKTWTTDSFYRETNNNFEKRKADGCISVEMECSAIQAMCDFRKIN